MTIKRAVSANKNKLSDHKPLSISFLWLWKANFHSIIEKSPEQAEQAEQA